MKHYKATNNVHGIFFIS